MSSTNRRLSLILRIGGSREPSFGNGLLGLPRVTTLMGEQERVDLADAHLDHLEGGHPHFDLSQIEADGIDRNFVPALLVRVILFHDGGDALARCWNERL